MDLNSSLFKLFEEPDMEIDEQRRKFLRKLGATGAVSITGIDNLSYQSVEKKLDDLYQEDFSDFNRERPDVLVDVFEIGDNKLEEDVIELLEAVHEENGVNLKIGRRKQNYPEKAFLEDYGGDVAKILGTDGYKGFVQDNVSSYMQEIGVQTLVTPGKVDEPEGWLEYDRGDEELYRTGFATESIALGSDNAFMQGYPGNHVEGKALVFIHELGHAYGLKHKDDPSNVMYENVDTRADLEYNQRQWEKIKENI